MTFSTLLISPILNNLCCIDELHYLPSKKHYIMWLLTTIQLNSLTRISTWNEAKFKLWSSSSCRDFIQINTFTNISHSKQLRPYLKRNQCLIKLFHACRQSNKEAYQFRNKKCHACLKLEIDNLGKLAASICRVWDSSVIRIKGHLGLFQCVWQAIYV